MKRLAVKAVCSVAVVLSIVFGMGAGLATSERGLEHVANLEGCRTAAYQCSADRWTAGIGHAQGVKPTDVLTTSEIAEYFVEDISSAEQVVKDSLKVDVTQSQFDVLVSFVFNLGPTNFNRSTLLKKFNRGDREGGCYEFTRWVFVNGKDCRKSDSNCAGIVKRRLIEQKACIEGWDYVDASN